MTIFLLYVIIAVERLVIEMASPRSQYLKAFEKEFEEETIKQFEIQKQENHGNRKNTTIHKQMNGSGYFAKDNVKEYQKEMLAHLFGKDSGKKKGRGGFFESEEELNEWIGKYFTLAMEHEVVPTISGLCTYLQCARDTLYNHASNPSSPFYNSCKNAIDYCHACLESGASESQLNSVAYIFQAKNYFNMKDVQEVKVAPNQNQISNNSDTLNALKEQIHQQEPHKQIDMREAEYVEIEK